jgi:protein gp37
MSENTKIEWATHTQNFWEGCQKAGPGCDNCYAEERNARFAGGTAINWGPGAPRRRTSESNWRKPLVWNTNHEAFFAKHGYRQRVFCSSLSDVFDNAVDPQWRADMMQVIANTPNLDWLLLTKRIGNARSMLDEAVPGGWTAWPNVWLGATIVNQEEADRDIPKLLSVPVAKRFLSMEPLLGPVDLLATPAGDILCRCSGCMSMTPDTRLDWVIVGGESTSGARPMHTKWVRGLRDQCNVAGVPFIFKQWGEWREPLEHEDFDTSMGRAAKPPAFILSENGTVHCFEGDHIINGRAVIKVGKKTAGRLLDGRTWDEVPQ